MNNKNPIGVFDSGVGGLTIVDKMMDFFPNEDIIYIADTINNPYGTKTPTEIENIVTDVSKHLETLGAKFVVIACNTATVHSTHLSSEIMIPFMGVVNPTAKSAYQASENNHILILATEATIQSQVYQEYMIQKKARYIALATPKFVEVIEHGNIYVDETTMLVEETLRPFASSGIDTVLLGCTHFELLEQQIRMILPSANIVASSQAVCEALEDRLDQRKIKNNDSKRGILRVYVTGNQENFERSIKWFNKPINVLEHIDIKNRC